MALGVPTRTTDKVALANDISPNRQNEQLEEWLDKLAKHENCPATGIIDSNGERSYGDFCYQKTTFVNLVTKYRAEYNLLPYAEEVEIPNWIADNEFQRELTKIVIAEESSKTVTGMWYTTIEKKGLGLPAN